MRVEGLNFPRTPFVVVRVAVVYILRCADGSVYVGHATDLEERVAAHNQGRAAVFTRNRRPVTVAYTEEHPSILDAVRRERQIKRWTRAKKEALIRGDLVRLKHL